MVPYCPFMHCHKSKAKGALSEIQMLAIWLWPNLSRNFVFIAPSRQSVGWLDWLFGSLGQGRLDLTGGACDLRTCNMAHVAAVARCK